MGEPTNGQSQLPRVAGHNRIRFTTQLSSCTAVHREDCATTMMRGNMSYRAECEYGNIITQLIQDLLGPDVTSQVLVVSFITTGNVSSRAGLGVWKSTTATRLRHDCDVFAGFRADL